MMIKVDEQLVENSKAKLLNTDEFVGIQTGFNNLDALSEGFANGQLIIMGARPAMGKTTFACSLLDNVCINGGKNCIFFTSDMSVQQTVERMIRLHGNVKLFEDFEEKGEDFADRIIESTAALGKANLWVDDTSVGGGDEFIEKCRQIGKDERIDLIIIDHLQLFESDMRDLNGLLMSLKQLAMEVSCPVLVLSQLNRSVEKRNDHMPRISDLPNSKIVEACADEILFLYRMAYYDYKANKNAASINIAKHTKFQRLTAHIYYDPEIPAFRTDRLFWGRKEGDTENE